MLIENIPIEILVEISTESIIHEKGRRKPPYNVFKWWGRRYKILSRAMLAALVTNSPEKLLKALKGELRDIERTAYGKLIYDPFCGGGTIALEASLLGFSAVCRDLNIAALYTARATYNACAPHCKDVYICLEKALEKAYMELENIWCFDNWCFLHVFGVRCRNHVCEVPIWLSTKNMQGEKYAVLLNEDGGIVMKRISEVNGLRPNEPLLAVDVTKHRLPTISKGVYAYAAEIYNKRTKNRIFISFLEYNDFSLKAKEYLREMITYARELIKRVKLETTVIPESKETKRLLSKGITTFENLFTPRQLLSFIEFLDNARGCKEEASLIVANVMRTCSLLAIYYQPYAKMNPALVIKSYWLPRYPAELNPLAYRRSRKGVTSLGRGVIATYLREYRRVCNRDLAIKGRIEFVEGDALIAPPPSNTFAVVTDPPYIGKQSYHDISMLHFYALKLAGLVPRIDIPRGIESYTVTGYVKFMKAFAERISNVPRGTYVVLLLGLSKNINNLFYGIAKSFVNEGFGIRNIYWFLGEAPGLLGRSFMNGVVVMVLRKGFPSNVDNMKAQRAQSDIYKGLLLDRLREQGLDRISKLIDFDTEFKLYKHVLEEVLNAAEK